MSKFGPDDSTYTVLRSRKYGAETIFEVSAMALGQTEVVPVLQSYLVQDQASDLNLFSFHKIMKTLHFNVKAVQTGIYQAEVRAGSTAEAF